MGLSNPRTIYGVHSLTLYDRSTWEPFGIIKVLGSLTMALSGEFNDLFGGSSKFAWDSESGVIDTSLTGTIKEIPDFAFEKFLGASVTQNAAEATGNVGSLTNKNGTSVMDATTGIASVAAKTGSESSLKTGLYVVKAVSATTVQVFCMSDYDFDQGTDETFEDDDLSLSSAALTVPGTSGTVDLDDFGLTFTGGSGVVAFETGDTAYFYVRKVNGGSSLVTFGQSTATFPEFGCLFASQKKGSGETFEG